jgi:hypothetical protein
MRPYGREESDVNAMQLDIRDIEVGETHYVILDPNRGGRVVLAGMFKAAWRDRADAAKFAKKLGDGFIVHKTIKR